MSRRQAQPWANDAQVRTLVGSGTPSRSQFAVIIASKLFLSQSCPVTYYLLLFFNTLFKKKSKYYFLKYTVYLEILHIFLYSRINILFMLTGSLIWKRYFVRHLVSIVPGVEPLLERIVGQVRVPAKLVWERNHRARCSARLCIVWIVNKCLKNEWVSYSDKNHERWPPDSLRIVSVSIENKPVYHRIFWEHRVFRRAWKHSHSTVFSILCWKSLWSPAFPHSTLTALYQYYLNPFTLPNLCSSCLLQSRKSPKVRFHPLQSRYRCCRATDTQLGWQSPRWSSRLARCIICQFRSYPSNSRLVRTFLFIQSYRYIVVVLYFVKYREPEKVFTINRLNKRELIPKKDFQYLNTFECHVSSASPPQRDQKWACKVILNQRSLKSSK